MRSGGAFRAVVLCAGRGERLRPLTDDRPKCLVTLAGRALLDWQLEALRAAGAAETGAVVGWQGHRVERPGLTRFWNDRWHDTTMVASLLAAAPWLEAGPCIAVYGDIVFHPDAVRTLAACPYDIAIAYDRSWRALWSARFARPEDDAETLRVVAGEVAEIGGRVDHLERVEGQYMGLVRTTPAGFARVRALRTALPP